MRYEYKTVYASNEPETSGRQLELRSLEAIGNRWAEDGWRTVSLLIVLGDVMFYLERIKPKDENEFGISTDVICVECLGGKDVSESIRRILEKKMGAWWCPVHRDTGHVRFEKKRP